METLAMSSAAVAAGGLSARAAAPSAFLGKSLRVCMPNARIASQRTRVVRIVAEASQTEQLSKTPVLSKESSSSATSQKTTYYYLIANAKFMLDDEEHFQEQMQEKERMYGERNKEQDFWLVIEPEFLDKHPEVAAKVGRPAVALVSTDKVWISFMKLRLDRVLKGELTVDSPEEVLAGKLTTVKFERPAKWIAPYPKYEGDWWTSFLYKKN